MDTHSGPEELLIVAAARLGVIHGRMRLVHHGIHVVAVIRTDTDTDAQGDADLPSVDELRHGENCSQLIGQLRCIPRMVDSGEQDHEFITALAAYRH